MTATVLRALASKLAGTFLILRETRSSRVYGGYFAGVEHHPDSGHKYVCVLVGELLQYTDTWRPLDLGPPHNLFGGSFSTLQIQNRDGKRYIYIPHVGTVDIVPSPPPPVP